jgi:hypothetical protein
MGKVALVNERHFRTIGKSTKNATRNPSLPRHRHSFIRDATLLWRRPLHEWYHHSLWKFQRIQKVQRGFIDNEGAYPVVSGYAPS